MSRPIEWTESRKKEAFDKIIEAISTGKSVRSILDGADRDEYPSFVTFNQWLSEDEELVKQYARACEIRSEIVFEEIIEIADDGKNDTYTDPDTGKVFVDHDVIARSRLRVDARKWMLSKMNPKKYGDKIETAHTGNVGLTWHEVKTYDDPDKETNPGT